MSYQHFTADITITDHNLRNFGYTVETANTALLIKVLEDNDFYAECEYNSIRINHLGTVAENAPGGGIQGIKTRIEKLLEITGGHIDQDEITATDEHGQTVTIKVR